MAYSIGQVADLAGISARMLRHYDKLGLLRPSRVSDNGYRWYERDQLFQLQRILLLRDYGLSLAVIKEVLANNDATRERELLVAHRSLVVEERDRLTQLLASLDLTLAEMDGGNPVGEHDFYAGLRTTRGVVRGELLARFGTPVDAAFRAEETRTAEWTQQDYEAAAERASELYTRLARTMNHGHSPGSVAAADLIHDHYKLVSEVWVPGKDSYLSLAGLYAEPGFQRDLVARIDPRLPEWLAAAIKEFAMTRL